jgi:hypothetical protein
MPLKTKDSGRLRIGDNWNAIRIIALSQSNPLKAVAELVENSIDARAKNITLVRGKERGTHFLRIKDDGEGIRRNDAGLPDFEYVATHICDSIKRRLKADGATGLQGEFGIGLLSFWTVGEELTISSAGSDGKTYQMQMKKGDPGYRIHRKNVLVPEPGTELIVRNILPGIKQFSGEKIQWYLASELRDRIRTSGVQIRVIDRNSRAEFKVEPRQFEGRLLHEVSRFSQGELYVELYLSRPAPANAVGLYRQGTRVLENLTVLGELNRPPWTSGYLQGLLDAPYLNLTPGTRSGLIQDAAYQRFTQELADLEAELLRLIEAQQRAEEEQTSREVLRSVQRALREALLALPAEEYDWFDLHQSGAGRPKTQAQQQPQPAPGEVEFLNEIQNGGPGALKEEPAQTQKDFFEFPGPLFSVRISPASSVVPVDGVRNFRAIARDRANRLVERDIRYRWELCQGAGRLDNADGEIATFQATSEPGLSTIRLTASQFEVECSAEALVTVTDSLLPKNQLNEGTKQGIPSYTFQKAPGELWRSRYQADQNVVVINNGHRDFVFASRNKGLKLRYICRLFAKELVARNFPGQSPGDLLERLIELTLYTEENLK